MEEELEEFLLGCGIDQESIATMKEQKIDFSTIRAMSPTELGRFVHRVGDIYKIKEFVTNYIKQNKPVSSTLLTLAQKLKTKIKYVKGTSENSYNNNCGAKNKAGPSPNSYKPTRKISVNWKCDNKIVRADEGGGARQIDAPKTFNKYDILEKAIALYFPDGNSIKKGPLADYYVDLLDFAANSFDENLTVEQIYGITGFTRLNFCLYTTLKPEFRGRRNKQKLKMGKKKKQVSSSIEAEATNTRPPTKRHLRELKQNSGYCLSTSSSSNESVENQDDTGVQSRETTNCLSNDMFDLQEFLNTHYQEPRDEIATTIDLPAASTYFLNATTSTGEDLPNEVFDFQKKNEQSLDLKAELTIIRQAILVEKPLLVNACRENPVSSMINAMKRSTFSPYQKLDVQFVDVDEVVEGAIDDGGPSRELFRLSLKQLQNSEIFLGQEESKIFTLNLTAIGKEKYLYAGKIFAMSIIHGGPRPNFLSKTVFDYLVNGFGYPVVEDLQHTPFQKVLIEITAAETLESFKNVITSHDELLDLGVSPASFENKDKLIKEILHHLVIDRPRRALEQFADGLKMLDVLPLIKKYPEPASLLFCYKKETQLTAKYLNRLFSIKRSSDGTHRRLLESKAIAFWRDYLQNCEDGDCQVCLSDVLAFATGCNTEPALGFDQHTTIDFLHDDPSVFPKSNTCALILYLPIAKADDYEAYRANLTFGILNGLPTFGLS